MQSLAASSTFDTNGLRGGDHGTAAIQPIGVLLAITLFLCLLWYSDAWIYKGDAQSELTVEKPLAQWIRAFANIAGVALLGRLGVGVVIEYFSRHLSLLMLLSVCAASVLWSAFPVNSAFAVVNYASLIALAAYISSRLPLREFLTLYFYFGLAILSLSLVLVFFFPEYGMMEGEHAGKFKGMFTHKNNFALFVSFLVSTVLFFWRMIYSAWALKLILLIASLYSLYMAGSSSGVSVVAIFGIIWLAINFTRYFIFSYIYRYFAIVVIVLFSVFLGYSLGDFILDLLGRDSSLTGRNQIWEYYLNLALDNPWLGHGFYSLQADPSLSLIALNSFNFAARSPHNAYLEVFYNVGSVGFAIYISFVLKIVLDSLKCSLIASDAVDGWAANYSLCFSVSYLAYSVVESYQAGLNAGLPFLIMLIAHSRMRSPVNKELRA